MSHDTPRTDAEAEIRCLPEQHDAQIESVPASLARTLERELAEARRCLSEAEIQRKRHINIFREMKLAMLGYPMSVRSKSPTRLLEAINLELKLNDAHELSEPQEAPK